MKSKFALAALAVPVGLAAYVTFHPGIAYAEPAYAQPGREIALQEGSFTADPMHTSVGFQIQHLGISQVQGRFEKVSGKLSGDPKKPEGGSVEFTIQADSVNTAVTPRDNHLKSPAFFDAAKYPTITFKSTKIRKAGKGYVAEGQLTMKETTKPISIPFKLYGPITDPWGGTRVGVVAEPITVNRQDYGIAYNDKLPDGTPAVANEVTIRLSMEAVQDKPK
ncbi:YceI family protein [soil metagenome]